MALAARVNDTAMPARATGQGVVPVRTPAGAREDTSVVPEIRELLRQAIDATRWKHDALAEVMGLCDRFYLSKMLSGEKAITAAHLKALPDDVEAKFAELYAESFGLIVVAPACGEDAARQFVAGLFGLLAPQKRMAKAALR